MATENGMIGDRDGSQPERCGECRATIDDCQCTRCGCGEVLGDCECEPGSINGLIGSLAVLAAEMKSLET